MDKADKDRRLAEALRANLKRRKAQAKSRRAGDADGRVGLPASDEAGELGSPSGELGSGDHAASLAPDSDRKSEVR